MTTLEMLKEALLALNSIPNTRYIGKYKDTYELASAIGKHIRDLEVREEDPYSSAMFKQLKFNYDKEDGDNGK